MGQLSALNSNMGLSPDCATGGVFAGATAAPSDHGQVNGFSLQPDKHSNISRPKPRRPHQRSANALGLPTLDGGFKPVWIR
jgi:hypothetical protein